MAAASFAEIPSVVLEKILCLLNGQDRATVRLVSRGARDACDSVTKFVTVKRSQWSGFPDLHRMQNCTVVLFLDDLATLPSFRLDQYEPETDGSFLLVCGEWWWKQPDLQRWIELQKNSRISKVGLMLCIMEQPPGSVDVCSLIEEVLQDGGAELNYFGVWAQLEESVPLSDGLTWTRRIPKLDGLEGLYLEFVKLDALALKSMQNLRELRMFFDEWDTSNIASFASMPALTTLFLEPARKDILEPSMLLGLGQNIRCLKVQGRTSSMAISDHPLWEDFMPELFDTLTSLERFEASTNAKDLVAAVRRILAKDPPPGDVVMMSTWVVCPFKGLWVALHRDTNAFRGVYRTVADARSAAEQLVIPEGFVLLF